MVAIATTSPDATPGAGRARRWAGQRERRRAEFVEAALAVIATHGPEASVEDIATHAGVARTRIYRHFTDRADLEAAISARVAELAVAELGPLWHPAGSARQMITGAIGAHLRWLAGNRNLHAYLRAHPGPPGEPGAADPDAPAPAPAPDPDTPAPDPDTPAPDPDTPAPEPAGPRLHGYAGVRRAVAGHLTGLFGGYLTILDVDAGVAENLAYAVVGMVESVGERWLEAPGGQDVDAVLAVLAAWTWAMLADVLGTAGVELDPDVPLPPLPGPGAR